MIVVLWCRWGRSIETVFQGIYIETQVVPPPVPGGPPPVPPEVFQYILR